MRRTIAILAALSLLLAGLAVAPAAAGDDCDVEDNDAENHIYASQWVWQSSSNFNFGHQFGVGHVVVNSVDQDAQNYNSQTIYAEASNEADC